MRKKKLKQGFRHPYIEEITSVLDRSSKGNTIHVYKGAAVGFCEPLQEAIYIHTLTGTTGTFLKEVNPTGRPLTWIIKTPDGREYFAPASEFKLIPQHQPPNY